VGGPKADSPYVCAADDKPTGGPCPDIQHSHAGRPYHYPPVGGGFGSKLSYYVDAALAAIGARIVGRPVNVAMTRPQIFHLTTHRTASEQRLRLGADRNGRLIAYSQDALERSAFGSTRILRS
jgi:CO/xanthine dehydrogenase Mo-binding subunit